MQMANSHPIMCDNAEPLLSLTEEQLCPTIQQPMVVVTIASTTVFLFLFFVLGWFFNFFYSLFHVAL